MSSPRSWLDAALTRLAKIGADPEDDEDMRLRKALLVLLAIGVWPISFVWATLFIALGSWTGWFAAIYLAISVASILLFARTGNASLLLRIQLIDIVISPTISMAPLGGFLGSGAVGLWGLLAPLGALVFNGVRSGVRWYVAFVVLFLGFGAIGTVTGPTAPVPAWFANVILGLNVVVGGTVFFTLLAIFAKQRQDALVALRGEHERAENLLLNILPGSIAERLKAQPKAIADAFVEVSVLFADVVDFTPRAEKLAAAEVVGVLDRLFSHFDNLAERYGLEKIKTIGDAYMVAAGVPDPRPDHARALALLALDMTDAVRTGGAIGDLGLEIRIGINSGPVVAGVIGRKRFLYDLWGDAVNTASRMESGGTPGQIQVTRATYELLRDEFTFEHRGTIPVKGKGEMETWYLVRRRQGAAAAGSAAAG